MGEKLSGKGKVFNGSKFIADVDYRLEIVSHYEATRSLTSEGRILDRQVAFLTINPPLSEHFGLDRLTLHTSDGRKQDFFITSSNGACQTTGGPHD